MHEAESRLKALRQAATARRRYQTQYADGSQPTAADAAVYARYFDDAYRHGITDAEIDRFLRTLAR